MSSEPPIEAYPQYAAVSRYKAFGHLIQKMGLIGADDPVFVDPHAEDIRGRHIVTDALDLRLAAEATAVTVVPLDLPIDLDSTNAPLDMLARYVGTPESFTVRGSSAFAIKQHRGGNTSGSTYAAGEILKHYKISSIRTDDLASKLDELFDHERRSGLETEEFLFRILKAAHQRTRPIPKNISY